MSLLTFHKSVINKNELLNYKSPFQILPSKQQFINNTIINSYPQLDKETKILIHTSFTTQPFSNKQCFIITDYASSNLYGYDKIADKLKTKYVLIHGPSNPEQYCNFIDGLKFIDKNFNDKIICIEIPCFSKDMIKLIHNEIKKDDYDFIDEYFNIIVSFNDISKNKFQIVIDTAHLHSNGLTGKQMFELLLKYKDNYDFIHFNGNSKNKYEHDKHIGIDNENDKIVDSCYLLENVVKLNKICILEEPRVDYNYFKLISLEYHYEIVENNKYYLIEDNDDNKK